LGMPTGQAGRKLLLIIIDARAGKRRRSEKADLSCQTK